MFKRAGAKSSNVTNYQFWQHDNHPIELWSPHVIEQKADYLHDNPVEAGFVTEAAYWKYSSAVNYWGAKGLIDIEFFNCITVKAHATGVRQQVIGVAKD